MGEDGVLLKRYGTSWNCRGKTMGNNLTAKQQQFFDYLKNEIRQTGFTPSLREAASVFSISHAAVAQLLKALEAKGYIKRDGRYSRVIHLLEPGDKVADSRRQKSVPIIGSITAGLPMYAQQEWDGCIVVDSDLYPGENLFALKVKGDSMKNAGIFDHDLAICLPRQYAENSEIIVALIRNEEATVKRFFLYRDHIELRPENPAYAARRYSFDEILIQGKVIGIIRGPEGVY